MSSVGDAFRVGSNTNHRMTGPMMAAPMMTPDTADLTDVRPAELAATNAGRASHVFAIVLAGLSAGFFYGYESSVTLGLAEVDDLTYLRTFQAINATIKNPLFGTVFFGSLPALLLANGYYRKRAWTPQRLLLALAPVLYVIGMAITLSGNVALNNELAGVEPTTSAIAADARDVFEDDWNRLNRYRTIAFIGAFAAAASALPLAPLALAVKTGRK